MDRKLFFSLKEYCVITTRSYQSALRDVKAGRVPSVRIGKTVLVPMSFFTGLAATATNAMESKESKVVVDE